MKEILFATGNKGKMEEMQPLFEKHEFKLEQEEVEIDEIDALEVEKVARQKAVDSFRTMESGEPVIVEDTGFFVEALGGFPGAKASFFDETVGAGGILDLMKGKDDRRASFRTAIAFHDGERVEVFSGEVSGTVTFEKRGDSHPHLPYDSFFVPDHGSGSSYAEEPELKRRKSQRKEAAERCIKWLNQEL